MKILVTGATGTLGSAVAIELAAAGADVRAAVHTPKKGDFLRKKGIKTVPLDEDIPESIGKALKGMEKLFLLTPLAADMVEKVQRVVDEAKKAGIRHIVRQSALGAEREGTTLHRWHREAEKLIEASGIPCTFLRPNFFMQNYLTWPPVHGVYYLPMGEAKISMVDVRDIAIVARAALLGKGHEGVAYPITGPGALSAGEAVGIIDRVCGEHFIFTDIAPEAARKGMLDAHMPEWLADGMLELYAWARKGEMAALHATVLNIGHKAPHTFEQFVKDFAKKFKGAARAA